MRHARTLLVPPILFLTALPVAAQDQSGPDKDYVPAMKKVAAGFSGRPGVVLHVGDSITYANPYGQWARYGKGRTAEDKAVLAWMHTGKDNDQDGWWLARFDHPAGNRSYTACSGLRTDELLAGGVRGMPALATMLGTYRPQLVVLLIGTNDVGAGRSVAAYRADLTRAIDTILGKGAVCILTTIPPFPGRAALSKSYNQAIRALAKARSVPLVDYEAEILRRRPNDWNGTLIHKNDPHPSVEYNKTTPAAEPTAENLKNNGYLLRCVLTVRKIADVKREVFDGLPAAPPGKGRSTPKEGNNLVKLPVTRDTWFSNDGHEVNCNLGGSNRLKFHSYQEMSLVDIDPAPLRGRVIKQATLHWQLADKIPVRRLTVSSFASDWVEGTSPSYAPQKGSSCHSAREYPGVPWTVPGSDLCAVMLGQGGTIWRMADATPPDAENRQQVPVEPAVVAARVAGVSYGFLLFDDTGTEWTRRGENFTLHQLPNRFIYSREAGPAHAPYLTVELGEADAEPPAIPANLRADAGNLPAGEAWVTWETPADVGSAGTIGFFVTVAGKPAPRYLIPAAGKPGETVRMHLRDLGLKPGERVSVAVKAVDGAGNIGPAAEQVITVSDRQPRPLPGAAPTPYREPAALPRLGDAELAIIDELDRVSPSGAMIPKQREGYLAANHLWSAKTGRLRLHAARNEFVAFQILVRGPAESLKPQLTFAGEAAALRPEFAAYEEVASVKGPLPDPLVPLTRSLDVPRGKYAGIHCEIYVPHEMASGKHEGKLTLHAGETSLEVPVSLEVWDFTLPDFLSFLPEMNCYGLPANERAYHRLAHRHRTVLNRVPYSQSGNVAEGCAPVWHRSGLDWSAWDRRFGPYFDGSAFADLPRKRVPLEAFYLPLHENWPTAMEGNYNGDYWADRAFPPSYRKTFTEATRQMAEHFQRRGWHGTIFQCFFNNKNYFKRNGWSRGSSPWLLDEPANFQDFWALRYFAEAFHEGIRQAQGTRGDKAESPVMVLRCDISRPQWQRDALDGLLDYNVVGGAMREYHRMVLDRKEANGEIVIEYGGSNAIEDSSMQPLGWCLDAWTLGCDGVLPWQTVGTAASWRQADSLALFYPPRPARDEGPVPSLRLKAYRRGQQDVEYLTLLTQLLKEPRWALGKQVREELHLAGERQGTGLAAGEDAGLIHFAKLLPQDTWALRLRIGKVLSEARLQFRRQLVSFRPPPRDPSRWVPGYVGTAK